MTDDKILRVDYEVWLKAFNQCVKYKKAHNESLITTSLKDVANLLIKEGGESLTRSLEAST